MDHKAYLAAVPSEQRKDLTRRNDKDGLIRFLCHIGAILVVAVFIGNGVKGWWLFLPVQGVLLMGLFMLTHECTHKTPFRTVWLNDAIGHFAGFAIGLPFRWFRYFHLAHHKWTNIPGQDPELEGGKPEGLRSWALHVSGIKLWWNLIAVWGRLGRGIETAGWMPTRALPAVTRDARMCLLLYGLIGVLCTVFPVIIWVWIVPLMIGQPFLRLYLLAEHGDCPQIANMFENTRTTYTSRALRWLTWNMPYHTEHHVWPDVPFHKLPALHRDMRHHLAHTADGYVAFNRGYLARRLQPDRRPDRANPAE